MSPPIRLRDDPAVARALRDDLTRAAASPPAGYDVAAGLARFEASLHAGAASGTAAASGGKTVLGAALKGALLGLVAVGGAAVVDRAPSTEPRPPPAVIAPMPAARGGALTTEPASAPAKTAAPAVETAKVPAPPLGPTARDRARPVTSVVEGPSSEPAPALAASGAPPAEREDSLAAEVEHLARQRALVSQDPAQALALAAEGSRRFPGGTFAQEREGLAIAALVRLGRLPEARARARVFESKYPRSALGEWMRRETGIDAGP